MSAAAKTIALVIYPGLTPLDIIGPLQVMGGLVRVEELSGGPPGHRVVVVAEQLEPVETDSGVKLAAEATFADVPAPHVVIVPGGGAPTLRQCANKVLLEYLRAADDTADVMASGLHWCADHGRSGAARRAEGDQALGVPPPARPPRRRVRAGALGRRR